MSETKTNKIWGLVHVGPLTFLGAFRDFSFNPDEERGLSEPFPGEADPEAAAIRNIDHAFELGKVVFLEPVLELQAPLQQVRQQAPGGERVGIAKSPLPMPYGFTTGKVALRVLRPDAWAYVNEMTEGDQKMYKSFIDSVIKAELEERAARSGLTLVSSNGVSRG